MHLRHLWLLAIGCILLPIAVTAQIKFEQSRHVFGQIEEAKGEVHYDFEFANTGTTPIIITNVQSSCGCTNPSWTKQPVLPGAKGYVRAYFDPKDRPGAFDKEITVHSNMGTTTLRITGEVLVRTKGLDELYPIPIGTSGLRIKASELPFTTLYNTQTAEANLPIVNTGKVAIQPIVAESPGHLTWRVEPAVLAPGQQGNLICQYNTTLKQDWGPVQDKVLLLISGQKEQSVYILVTATINENFELLSPEERAQAPILEISQRSFNLGKQKAGSTIPITISISNTGQRMLTIHKISSNCESITISSAQPQTLATGQNTTLEATWRMPEHKGRISQQLYITSNAPQQANTAIRVTAVVE